MLAANLRPNAQEGQQSTGHFENGKSLVSSRDVSLSFNRVSQGSSRQQQVSRPKLAVHIGADVHCISTIQHMT